MLKKEDRNNLIQSLPVYFLMLVLVSGMVILSLRKLSKHGNEPLSSLISKNLQGLQPEFRTIDEVINARKSWEPTLPNWQGRKVPDLTFSLPDGQIRHLSDYQGRECIVIIGATWFPSFRLQISQILPILERTEQEPPAVFALTVESLDRLEKFSRDAGLSGQDVQMGKIEELPEPYSLPDGFPCLFFVDAQGRLKLAATGLIPTLQVEALCRLPLPQEKEGAD